MKLAPIVVGVFSALAGVVIGSVPLVPTEAQALPSQSYYIRYYSDASHTQVVGWKWMECDGSKEEDGEQTLYYTKQEDRCTYPTIRTCQLCAGDLCSPVVCGPPYF
jgi:hypothetical protein